MHILGGSDQFRICYEIFDRLEKVIKIIDVSVSHKTYMKNA